MGRFNGPLVGHPLPGDQEVSSNPSAGFRLLFYYQHYALRWTLQMHGLLVKNVQGGLSIFQVFAAHLNALVCVYFEALHLQHWIGSPDFLRVQNGQTGNFI